MLRCTVQRSTMPISLGVKIACATPVDVAGAQGPFLVDVQLWYQPIAYRWVENLRTYDAAEPRRFVDYFDEMSPASALMLTRAARTISEPSVGNAPASGLR